MLHVRVNMSSNEEGQMALEDKPPCLSFETGNPRVENLRGKLHFYRSLSTRSDHSNSYDDCVLLCLLGMPLHFSPLEFLEFTHECRKDMVIVRMLKDIQLHRYLALIQFHTTEKADLFFTEFNGRMYNSMENERCSIVRVETVEFLPERKPPPCHDEWTIAESQVLPCLYPHPPIGFTEIPTCAVCLDRLDLSPSGIFTTICNHSFHCDCLYLW